MYAPHGDRQPGVFQCFHGTDKTFDASDFHDGTFFSSRLEVAAFFAAGGHVMEVVLVSDNYRVVDFSGGSWGGSFLWQDDELVKDVIEYASDGDEEEREYWEENGVTVDVVASYLNEIDGYDLIVCENVTEENEIESTIYVAYRGCRAYTAQDYEHLFAQ